MGESYKDWVLSSPRDPNIPEGVGPHEGIELELMLAGTKPAAMFHCIMPEEADYIPDNEFDPYVVSGQFVKKEITYHMLQIKRDIHYVFYALASEQWRIDKLEQIKQDFWNGFIAPSHYDAMDAAVGRLLGYTEEQIDIFLEHSRKIRAEIKH